MTDLNPGLIIDVIQAVRDVEQYYREGERSTTMLADIAARSLPGGLAGNPIWGCDLDDDEAIDNYCHEVNTPQIQRAVALMVSWRS